MGSRVLFLVLATSTLCFSSTFRVTLRPATTIFTNGVTPTVDPITVTLRDPPPVNYISPLFIYNLGSVNIDATQFAARPDYGTQLRYQRNGTPPGFGYDLLQITGSTSWQDSGTEYVQNYGLEYDPTSPYSYATYSYPLSLAYYQYNAGSGMWESSLSLRDTFQSLHDTNKAVLFSIAQLTHVNTVYTQQWLWTTTATVESVQEIPEPSSFLLMGGAAVLLRWLSSRRHYGKATGNTCGSERLP